MKNFIVSLFRKHYFYVYRGRNATSTLDGCGSVSAWRWISFAIVYEATLNKLKDINSGMDPWLERFERIK